MDTPVTGQNQPSNDDNKSESSSIYPYDTPTGCSFFGNIGRVVGRKPFIYGLRLSKSLVDQWCTGEKRDPFTLAKEAIEIICQENKRFLIPSILRYIAGPDFDRAVLQVVVEALTKKGKES